MSTTRRTPILVHLCGAAAAAALLAYWAQQLAASPRSIAPVDVAPPPLRDPDVGLAGRMFGDAGTAPAAGPANVQVSGVFAAGRASSAVIAIDGRPPRAVLLGQELSAGLRLAEVHPDGVTLEQAGTRLRYSVPAVPLAQAAAPQNLFQHEGAVLTAPSVDPATLAHAAAAVQGAAQPAPPAGLPPGMAPMPGRAPAGQALPRRGPQLGAPPELPPGGNGN